MTQFKDAKRTIGKIEKNLYAAIGALDKGEIDVALAALVDADEFFDNLNQNLKPTVSAMEESGEHSESVTELKKYLIISKRPDDAWKELNNGNIQKAREITNQVISNIGNILDILEDVEVSWRT